MSNKAGVIMTKSGAIIDLSHAKKGWFPEDADFRMSDIAWALGRTLRYNGHIRQDYTVAHHSIILSYFVPRKYRLEALLHDAAEAYVGDVISPVKELVPEFARLEDVIAGHIMQKFGDAWCATRVADSGRYIKSKVVASADHKIYQHECFMLGERPGLFNKAMHEAWEQAAEVHADTWPAPQHAFIERFIALTSASPEEIRKRLDHFDEVTAPASWYGSHVGYLQEEAAAALESAIMDATEIDRELKTRK